MRIAWICARNKSLNSRAKIARRGPTKTRAVPWRARRAQPVRRCRCWSRCAEGRRQASASIATLENSAELATSPAKRAPTVGPARTTRAVPGIRRRIPGIVWQIRRVPLVSTRARAAWFRRVASRALLVNTRPRRARPTARRAPCVRRCGCSSRRARGPSRVHASSAGQAATASPGMQHARRARPAPWENMTRAARGMRLWTTGIVRRIPPDSTAQTRARARRLRRIASRAAPGKYKDTSGSANCASCPSCPAMQTPSTPCTAEAAGICVDCPTGKYSHAGDAQCSVCTACAAGTYDPCCSWNLLTDDWTCPDSSNADCSQCTATAPSPTCIECPTGMYKTTASSGAAWPATTAQP